MIEGNQYVKTVKEYYSFLIEEFGFKVSEEKIRSNVFYDVQYKDKARIVSISYENIEDLFLVIVFLLKNGEMPDYDDKTKTLHLNQLNKQLMPFINKSEILLNNEQFLNFFPKNEVEKKLLKSAKELRLSLLHFEAIDLC